MLQAWRLVHHIPAILRWPIKWVLAVAVTALILFPKIWLLPIEIERIGNFEPLIEPNHPVLAPLAEQVEAEVLRVKTKLPEAEVPANLRWRVIEQVVYSAIPYAHDWEVWGVMQYTPTLDEAFAAGREDCDGRAIVAASLYRRLGFEAWIVTDLQHAWVRTNEGDAMGTGKGEPTVKQDAPGEKTRVVWNLALLTNMARGTAWGMGAFPLTRMICFYLLVVALTLHPWASINRRLIGAVVMLIAMGLLREGGVAMLSVNEPNLLVWSGMGLAIVGWVILAVKAGEKPLQTTALESREGHDAVPG